MSDLDDALDAYDPGPRARMCGDGKRADSYDRARAELAALRDQVETLRLQLAGCGVVAMANTRRSADEVRNGIAEKYKCASLSDVCRAVDREIDLRERVAKLEAALVKADRLADSAWYVAELVKKHSEVLSIGVKELTMETLFYRAARESTQ